MRSLFPYMSQENANRCLGAASVLLGQRDTQLIPPPPWFHAVPLCNVKTNLFLQGERLSELSDLMDNLHYGPTLDLDNKNSPKEPFKSSKIPKIWLKNIVMCGRHSLTKFANFLINIHVLRAEIVTIFEPKLVTISSRNTMIKYANFVSLYFPLITTIFQPNFGILPYRFFPALKISV